jgi:hypothetical protein
LLLKEGLPADDCNQAIMNSRMRKKASPHFTAEERPAIKTRFVKAADAASPASYVSKNKSKSRPIKKPFAAVGAGTSCYQSRSKSDCFFEPCLPCICYASGMLDSTVPGVIQHGLASLSIVKFILLLGVQ